MMTYEEAKQAIEGYSKELDAKDDKGNPVIKDNEIKEFYKSVIKAARDNGNIALALTDSPEFLNKLFANANVNSPERFETINELNDLANQANKDLKLQNEEELFTVTDKDRRNINGDKLQQKISSEALQSKAEKVESNKENQTSFHQTPAKWALDKVDKHLEGSKVRSILPSKPSIVDKVADRMDTFVQDAKNKFGKG